MLSRRKGVDIRPTLVRVLTDLYVQKALHSPEEERHYTELVLRLIEGVDIATRAIVARKLANYAAAPLAVLRRLARDVAEVAEPILGRTSRVARSEAPWAAAGPRPRYAKPIDRHRPADAQIDPEADTRANVDPPPDGSAAGSGRERDDHGPASPGAERRNAGAPPAIRSDPRPPSAPPSGDLFLSATSAERRLMLANLEAADRDQPSAPAVPVDAFAVRRMEAAALARKPEWFAAELARALELSRDLARRIVADPSGEPLLVAVKAAGMAPEVLARVLLFLDPRIGQSVERVFDLARLYERLDQGAATRLVAAIRGADGMRRHAATYRPVNYIEDGERVSRAAAEAARRQVGTAAAGPGQEPRREAPAAAARRQPTT